ncbi:unnamed protein product [Symbiodinium natans]|uniref:Uncharacterized protein n=1 Tax=Symbiodinium natans TaxID=878477 RepID=A0A812RYE0_9DINO|nr:unnamed protein product [Symbiodinium natans]
MARVAHLLALSDDWETQTRKKLLEVHKQTKFQLDLVNTEELKEKRYSRVGHKAGRLRYASRLATIPAEVAAWQVFMQNLKNSNRCWSDPEIGRELR